MDSPVKSGSGVIAAPSGPGDLMKCITKKKNSIMQLAATSRIGLGIAIFDTHDWLPSYFDAYLSHRVESKTSI